MCAGCRSYQSQDFDANQFSSTKNGSMGDQGIAMQSNTKYDGDNGQDQKFEGMAPAKLDKASTVEYTGRQ